MGVIFNDEDWSACKTRTATKLDYPSANVILCEWETLIQNDTYTGQEDTQALFAPCLEISIRHIV